MFVAVSIVAFLIYSGKQPGVETVRAPRYVLPETVSVFSTLNFLKRIHNDESLNLPDAKREELAGLIDDLERSNFSPDAASSSEPDLESLAAQWLTAAEAAHA
ncbi:MAG: hypothetical protein AAF492_32325 [Verrucomicrobiota bacterium]